MRYNNVFGKRRQGYTTKGIVATGGLLALGAAIALYGASKIDDTIGLAKSKLEFGNQSGYERTIDSFADLGSDDKYRVVDNAWDELSTEQKIKIIGDDLEIKVSDLYQR